MFEYTIAAIPTIYNGRRYRSRLEARWAAFFDRLQWKFEYEPIDLGAWSPDFLIHGCGKWEYRNVKMPTMVEVKPILSFDKSVASRMIGACRSAGFDGGLILAGTSATYCWVFAPHKVHPVELVFNRDDYSWDVSCDDRLKGAVEPTTRRDQFWIQASNEAQWRGRDAVK